jgi:hypothetical protein
MKTTVFAPKPVVSITKGPKVGDILVGTWGYEARLATYVKVVKVLAKSVVVVELDEDRVYDSKLGGMYWTSTPNIHMVADGGGACVTKRISPDRDGGYCIKWNNFTHLYPWNGQPLNCYDVH